jgi:hypothetical protein
VHLLDLAGQLVRVIAVERMRCRGTKGAIRVVPLTHATTVALTPRSCFGPRSSLTRRGSSGT